MMHLEVKVIMGRRKREEERRDISKTKPLQAEVKTGQAVVHGVDDQRETERKNEEVEEKIERAKRVQADRHLAHEKAPKTKSERRGKRVSRRMGIPVTLLFHLILHSHHENSSLLQRRC